MNRVIRSTLKIAATAGVLIVVMVGAGVGYTWYIGQQEPGVIQQQATPTVQGVRRIATPPKVDQNAKMGASVQSITSPVTPGSNASVTIKTNPLAACAISVVYDKTPGKDSGLIDKKADEYGIAEWTWTVDVAAPLGKWPVKVTCANQKYSAVVQNDLVVVDKIE